MTVAELIAALRAFPPHTAVRICTHVEPEAHDERAPKPTVTRAADGAALVHVDLWRPWPRLRAVDGNQGP